MVYIWNIIALVPFSISCVNTCSVWLQGTETLKVVEI
jgi:hypothetical protein